MSSPLMELVELATTLESLAEARLTEIKGFQARTKRLEKENAVMQKALVALRDFTKCTCGRGLLCPTHVSGLALKQLEFKNDDSE